MNDKWRCSIGAAVGVVAAAGLGGGLAWWFQLEPWMFAASAIVLIGCASVAGGLYLVWSVFYEFCQERRRWRA